MKHYTNLGEILGCPLPKMNFRYSEKSEDNLPLLKQPKLPALMAEFVKGIDSNCGVELMNSENVQSLVTELQFFADQFCNGSQIVRQSFAMPDDKYGVLEAVPSLKRLS
jgi:hypothetical protein